MRWLILTLSAYLISACATSTSVAGGDRLQSKSLAPGKCGLFGWTTDEARDFIFYADEKTARYAEAAGPIELMAETKFPSLTYRDPANQPVELRLGAGELMSGGMRYPGARIVTQTEEGWERLRPVAIVKSCQPK